MTAASRMKISLIAARRAALKRLPEIADFNNADLLVVLTHWRSYASAISKGPGLRNKRGRWLSYVTSILIALLAARFPTYSNQ